jgi:hypothetical protein
LDLPTLRLGLKVMDSSLDWTGFESLASVAFDGNGGSGLLLIGLATNKFDSKGVMAVLFSFEESWPSINILPF